MLQLVRFSRFGFQLSLYSYYSVRRQEILQVIWVEIFCSTGNCEVATAFQVQGRVAIAIQGTMTSSSIYGTKYTKMDRVAENG